MSEQRCGSAETVLVVIRGNSGSGKSTIAAAARAAYGRGCALVGQDNLRRTILKELDTAGGFAPEFVGHTVRYLLDHGWHVILEGILSAKRHSAMISDLLRDHRGVSSLFYLDIPLDQTLRRHQLRPQATEFTADDMRGWHLPHDVLGIPGETVIGEHSTFDESVALVLERSRLLEASAGRIGV